MASEKIFSITGKEIRKQKASQKKDDKIAEKSLISSIRYWNGFHVFSVLSGCGLAMSTLTLIPRHNSILHQEYWFEIILPIGFLRLIWAAAKVLDLNVLIENDKLRSIVLFLKIFFTSFVTQVTLYCSSYFFWTRILGHNHPMPLVGIACTLPTSIIQILSTPFLINSKLLEEEDFKRKMKFFVLHDICWFMTIFMRIFLSRIFDLLEDTNAQCIIALLILIMKKFMTCVLTKVVHRMIGNENEGAKVLVAVSINVCFGFWAATKLAGARNATLFCMVVLDILMQANMTHQIVKIHKKLSVQENEKSKLERRTAILRLVVAELCEGLVPLAYALGFAMAYYGPNSKLIGNVGNEEWHYKAVDDVSYTFLLMSGLFVIDLICLSLNSITIWITSNVNILQEFCNVLQKYWFVFGLKLAYQMYVPFLSNDVNNGSDRTYKFSWLANNKTSV